MALAGTLEIQMYADIARIKSDMAAIKGEVFGSMAHVKSSVQGAADEFNRLGSVAKKALGLIGVAASLEALKSLAGGVIEAAAAVGHLSERVGGSAEAWSGIAAAAKLSGTSFELVETSAARLTRAMSGSEVETKGSSKAFEFLGVSARDASHNMLPTEKVMLNIALAMAKYQDGAGKAAIAQDIFGKGGAALIPMLKELAERGEQFGKITDDMAHSAIEYEKTLRQLAASKNELVRTITFAALPAFQAFLDGLLDMKRESDSAGNAIKKLKEDGSINEWASIFVTNLAQIIDAFRWVGAVALAFASSVRVVAADIEFLGKATAAVASRSTDGVRAAWDERNAVLADANKKWADLLDMDLNKTENYVKKSLGVMSALAGRTGPQFLDARDLKAHPALLDAGAYSSATAQKATKELGDEILKRLALIRAGNALEKALYEAAGAVYKAILDNQLTDLKAAFDLRLISERNFIEQDSAIRVKLAEGNLERLTKEHDDAVAVWYRMYAELDTIRETDADKRKKLIDDAIIQMGEVAQNAVRLAGQEAVARGAVTAEIKKGTIALELYEQKIQDQIRLVSRNADDFVRGLSNQTAAEQLQLGLITATNLQQQIANTTLEATIKLEDARIAHERELADLVRTKADQRLIDAENEKYAAINSALETQRDKHLALLPLLEEEKKRAQGFQDAFNAIDSSAFDLFKGILTHGADTWQKLRDSLKDTFVKYLYELTLQKWIVQIFAGIGGAGAASGAGATTNAISAILGGSSGTGGLLSSLGDLFSRSGSGAGFGMNDRSLGDSSMAGLFDKYLGVNSAVVSGVGGVAAGVGIGLAVGRAVSGLIGDGGDTHHDGANIGSVVGAIIGAYWGAAGSAVGGAIGGAAGGLLDAFNPGDAQRDAKVGSGPNKYTFSSSSKFGDTGILQGSDHWFGNDMDQTLRTWFQTVGKLDTEVAKHFSGAEINKAIAALAGQSSSFGFGIEHSALDPEVLSSIVKIRFAAIFGVIDQQMADLVSNFKGSGQDLITLIVDLSAVHEKLAGLHDSLASLFGQSVGFADIARLKGETETYSDALSRLAGEYAATNQIAEMLGKTQEEVWGAIGLASEGARAHLIDLAGGIDKLSTQLTYYYEHFYTTQEQQAHTLARLQQAFTDANVVMPLTVDGFREIADHFLSMGEAGAQTAATLLGMAPTFYAYIQDVEAVNKAIVASADTFNALFGQAINLDDIRGLQANGEKLTDTLTRVTGEFASTNELIGMFGLKSDQVFGAFGLASEAARAKLIELSGGLDKFTSNLQGFYQNYFSDSERHAASLQTMQDLFKSLNIAMPDTTAGFREIIQQQLALGPAGAAAAAALLGVQQQFFDLFNTVTVGSTAVAGVRGTPLTRGELAAAAAVGQKAVADLTDQLYVLSHTSAEVGAKARADQLLDLSMQERIDHLAPGMLVNLQLQINAQEDLRAALARTTAATATQSDLWGQFATDQMKLGKATQEVQDGFAALGVAVPRSAEGFANLVASINPATTAGQEFLDFLKKIAPAFALTVAQIATATSGLVAAPDPGPGYVWVSNGDGTGYWKAVPLPATPADASSILNDRLKLLAEIYALTGDKAAAAAVLEQQHALALAALDPSLRALQTQLWGLQAAAEAAAKAAEFAKSKTDLQIQIERALGHEDVAVALEHANTIADINKQWGIGTDQANELIAMYQQLWSVQSSVGQGLASWIKQLQDWLRGLQLDSTLSPLTGPQRLDVAHQQYVDDLLKAQGGDADARNRFTQDADAYLKEALSMYGRASGDYEAIYQAIVAQTNGLIAQGLGPSAPATLTDVQSTMTSGQATAKEQADSLLAKVSELTMKVDQLTVVNRDAATTASTKADDLINAVEHVGGDTATALGNNSSGGLLATR